MNWRLAAVALCGATTVLGFAPFALFPLPFITLTLLFVVWRRADSPGQAAWQGFAWGLGCFLAGVSWVYVSMHDVGGMAAPVAALATVLLCVLLAAFPALAGHVFVHLRPRSAWRQVIAAAGLWTLNEWLRGWIFTGFPWLALGYAQTPPSPLAGYAPVLGVYGVGLVTALVAAVAAFLPQRKLKVLVIVVLLAGGFAMRQVEWTRPVGAPLSVSLLQGNIEQSLKWEPGRARFSLDTYARLAQENPAGLTVLPETALPMLLEDVPRQTLQSLTNHGDVLLGIPLRAPDGGFFNAAVALTQSSGSANSQVYAKSHLVPFGEYIPPGFAWFLALMNMPMGDFNVGPVRSPPLEIAGQRIAPNICYEDLFGEEIRHALPEATLLINLSNTAWFGHSLAQPQHLQISTLRALETGRTMLRATNTGMTAMVLPDGNIAALLPAFTTGVLHVEAQGYTGATPYVRWGNTPVLLAALAMVIAGWQKRRSS